MSRQKPVKYLNNKDMLKEIHASKMSFCYSVDPAYYQFDIIVDSVEEITPTIVQQAKENRAARMSSAGYEVGIDQWYDTNGTRNNKPKQADFKVDASEIQDHEVVFRVMTYEHVPETPGRKKNPKTKADAHTRVNFPPFKHYAFVDGELKEVVRSHWEGGFENGHFNSKHGNLTPTLARMMIKLVERYAMRGNWRGYTYNDEMQSAALLQLSEVGLKFNEARSQNPFAYYTATITNSFTRVLNLEKRNQNIRDDILQDGGYMPSYNRQLDDEAAQQRARSADEDRDAEELKNRGYNII
jgi:hypothetical protein